jgi:hypothetical protein
MANGTSDERIARADRIAEQSAKAQRDTEQNRRGTQNAIAKLREAAGQPGSEPYRAEMDSVSEVTLGREGVKIKARSPWVTVVLAGFALVAFLGWLWLRR